MAKEIKVIATRPGYYEEKYRPVGEVFMMEMDVYMPKRPDGSTIPNPKTGGKPLVSSWAKPYEVGDERTVLESPELKPGERPPAAGPLPGSMSDPAEVGTGAVSAPVLPAAAPSVGAVQAAPGSPQAAQGSVL